MIIENISLQHILIQLIAPFRTSFGLIDKRPAIIIKITDDEGHVGYGEASPLYYPISESETLDKCWNFLINYLPSMAGKRLPATFELAKNFFSDANDFPLAKAGLEAAFFCLLSKREKIPLRKLFGSEKNEVEVGESVGIKESIELVITDINKYLATGIKRIKIKIKPGHDFEIMKAVRTEFPDLILGADANAAYSLENINCLLQLDQFNLNFIEQPFKAADKKALVEFKKKSVTPVCLDESIGNLKQCRELVDAKLCDIVNIKPARVGGYSEAKKIHDYCFERKIPLFGGGRLETGIGKMSNAQFYSLPGFTLPSDLTPPREYFIEDIIDVAMLIEDGKIKLNDIAGLGTNILDEKIKKHEIENKVFYKQKSLFL